MEATMQTLQNQTQASHPQVSESQPSQAQTSQAQTSQAHSLIASDRVEGTPVRRTSGEKIGTIERLMIDKLTGNVAYAVLSFGGFIGIGQKHAPIPWARLTYDRMLGAYHLDLSDEDLRQAPSVAAGE